MSREPFTIRIFVPDGEPEGVRIIDRMNWTGIGIIFPREKWPETKQRREFGQPGVYILVGPSEDKDKSELPRLYIGQSDNIRKRIDQHDLRKEFWNRAIAFFSSNNGLNRAHVTWIEHKLVEQANNAGQSDLENSIQPQEPSLSESEKADTQAFLREVLQILPLVGLRAFEKPKAIAIPNTPSPKKQEPQGDEIDTVIVPAQREGFERVFLGENAWRAIRIGGGMLSKIRYIAAYQSQPISAITHVAPVARIEPYGEDGKYKLIFAAPAKEIPPIPFGNAPVGYMQGPRYVSYNKLMRAKNLSDLISKMNK